MLPPFSAPPGAVVYVMRRRSRSAARSLGRGVRDRQRRGRRPRFKVWVNDLDIVYDQRVLVDHVGKGSASRLDDWQALWARNRRRFLDKWTGDGRAPARRVRSRSASPAIARPPAPSRDGWSGTSRRATGPRRSRSARDVSFTEQRRPEEEVPGLEYSRGGRAIWRRMRPHLPAEVARRMRRRASASNTALGEGLAGRVKESRHTPALGREVAVFLDRDRCLLTDHGDVVVLEQR